MITTAAEYYQNLFRIQEENFPGTAVLLPSDERIYEINMSARSIEVPEFLSVATDHKAETIYFKIDRFFDYMDLTECTCVIEYVNANKKSHYYVVPFYDNTTFYKESKILFPWCIDGAATEQAGVIEFAIRFYKIDSNNQHFIYNLSTLPHKSKILYGINNTTEFNPEDYEIAQDKYLILKAEIDEIKKDVLAGQYWLDADMIN